MLSNAHNKFVAYSFSEAINEVFTTVRKNKCNKSNKHK